MTFAQRFRRGTLVAAAVLSLATAWAAEPAAERPVERELKTFSDGVAKQAPDAAKTFEAGIAEVAASGVVERAAKVGDPARRFELPDAEGKPVKLDDLLAKGPVVLTWYRGGWCPYCNIGLRGLVKAEPKIRELGATLVAITPETPDRAAETAKAGALTFRVLSDKGNAVARSYKLAYRVPEKPLTAMKGFGLDLEKINGDSSNELPLSVTYVIDREGIIRWAFVDADYRKRAEPADVLAALEALK